MNWWPLKRIWPAFALCCLPDMSACPGQSVLVSTYGYIEIRPPSTLFAPGATIIVLHRKPLEAAFVCGPKGSLGAGLVVQKSRTMGQALSKLKGTSIELEANYMEAIRGHGQFEHIEAVTLTIDKAEIRELQDEDVLTGAINRSTVCKSSIEARLKNGFKVTMISSALMGDMRFGVKWSTEAKMSVKAKVDALSCLAVEMGGGAISVTESEIRSVGLVFGIRTSDYLFSLSMGQAEGSQVDLSEFRPPPSLRENDVPRREMLRQIAYVASVPDAPIVRSADYDVTKEGWVDRGNERIFNQPLPALAEGMPIFMPMRPPTAETTRRNTLARESIKAREAERCETPRSD